MEEQEQCKTTIHRFEIPAKLYVSVQYYGPGDPTRETMLWGVQRLLNSRIDWDEGFNVDSIPQGKVRVQRSRAEDDSGWVFDLSEAQEVVPDPHDFLQPGAATLTVVS